MKILVVEDDDINIEILEHAFIVQDFKYFVAKNATEGLRQIKLEKFDVILLDLMLPDMSGHEFLTKIRNMGFATPVIITSACADTENKVKGFKNMADDYLVKPFDEVELICRMCIQVRHKV